MWNFGDFRRQLDATFLLLVVVCVGCGEQDPTVVDFPRKPIKVIVPFDAGGGSDTFTRILQHAIDEHSLLPYPLVVINVPGAGGTIGSRRTKDARPDGYTLLQLHEGILTSKYAGNSDFGPEAFEPIAGTGRMAHVIAVRDDSKLESIQSLVRAAAHQPDSIIFAVGIAAPSHYAGLMLENAFDNAKFRFVQSGGGAKRFAGLLGGHTDVTTFSVAEFMEFRASGLRALAILSNDRHSRLPDVPTAREQGLDVLSTNMHYWWAPKGTPHDRVETVATVLQEAMESDSVQTHLRQLATEPIVLTGARLQEDLLAREIQIAEVSPRNATQMPNFPMYVLGACLFTGILAVRQPFALRNPTERSSRNLFEPMTIILLLVLYVGSMQVGLLSYQMATFLFVVGSGGTLTRKRLAFLPLVFVLAFVLSFGLYAVFTHVLVIDLPS